MNSMTQSETILDHLRKHGQIDQLEAMREYGIMRLASRISELKAAGVLIKSENVPFKSKSGTVSHYTIYRLEK